MPALRLRAHASCLRVITLAILKDGYDDLIRGQYTKHFVIGYSLSKMWLLLNVHKANINFIIGAIN